VITAAEAPGKDPREHVAIYRPGIEERLTGTHETAHHSEFSDGVSDRASTCRGALA
jgi:glutamine synthetase